MHQHLQNPVFSVISACAEQRNTQAFVIGGFVRDIFLHRPNTDIDVVTLGNGIDLAEAVARTLSPNITVAVFKNFGTAMFHYHGCDYEFVGARKESYVLTSRKPTVETGTLEDDQNRRDFTINAMAISLNKHNFGELIDPFDGIADIERNIIRTPLNPDITFSDDPLRMMRAVRFAAQLNFTILPETFDALIRNCKRLEIVSIERIMDEFQKIMATPKPSIGILLLEKAQLLNVFFPELTALKGVEIINGKGHKDVFYHTLEVLDNVAAQSQNLWLRWVALLHDIAKPRTKKYAEPIGWSFHGHEYMGSKMVAHIFKRLRLPMNEKMRYVQKLVSLHLRPIVLIDDEVTDSAVRRLLFDAGDDIDDVMLLAHADITSKNEVKVRTFHQNFEHVKEKLREVEEKDALRNWQPPVSGEEIMKTFNLAPSRPVGILKDAIREAILEGDIENTHEAAFAFMLKKAEELGIRK
ncbi:MAG: CCA tRNA nucleotidyltransferase [Bacteroidales bacterium]|jgi:tRNA nucleotidyltransferase/poly(A) polymerase|nr:CCA tRNA nucleotidyltransferase [Bacteroidales bacterium]